MFVGGAKMGFLGKELDDWYLEEIIDNELVRLRKNNKNYQKLIAERIELKEKNQKLLQLIENNTLCELTKADSKDFLKYLTLLEEICRMEKKEIFFLGMKEAYYLFNEMGLLKERGKRDVKN